MEAGCTYDAFLQQQLQELHARLLEKHTQLVNPDCQHRPRETVEEPLSGADAGDTFEAVLAQRVSRRRPSQASSTLSALEDYDITGKVSAKSRWTDFCARLMELEENDLDVALISRPELTLHPAWHLAWEQAQHHRHGRQTSTQDMRTRTLRFNDVFTDEASYIQKFVVGPDSRLQLMWAALATVFIIWDMVTIPLELFPLDQAFENVIYTVAMASFTYWVIDVPLHLIFGVQVGGAVEMRPAKLFQIYMRSWLVADLIVVFVDLIILILNAVQASTNPLIRSGRFVRILRMVRLIRLLRVAKLEREFMLVANYFFSAYTMMALKLGSYLALMLAVNHLIACFWYGVGIVSAEGSGNDRGSDGNWLERSHIDPSDAVGAYIAAMHWSLTQFTPSTNSIGPANTWERFFAIWVILLAMACFSSFIGSIGAAVNTMRMARREELLQTAKLERFFMERNLSVDLFTKVQSAVKHDTMIKMRLEEEEVSLIKNIPERFKMMLHSEMFRPALAHTGIWTSYTMSSEDQDLVHGICHQCMREHACKLGQDVFLPRAKSGFTYVLQSGMFEYDVRGFTKVNCVPGVEADVLCLPALWLDWNNVGRLSGAGRGACNYVTIEADHFSRVVVRWGGPPCEYLKTMGLLLMQTIEALSDKGVMVTDVFDEQQLQLQQIVPRAERFAKLRGLPNFKTRVTLAASPKSS